MHDGGGSSAALHGQFTGCTRYGGLCTACLAGPACTGTTGIYTSVHGSVPGIFTTSRPRATGAYSTQSAPWQRQFDDHRQSAPVSKQPVATTRGATKQLRYLCVVDPSKQPRRRRRSSQPPPAARVNDATTVQTPCLDKQKTMIYSAHTTARKPTALIDSNVASHLYRRPPSGSPEGHTACAATLQEQTCNTPRR